MTYAVALTAPDAHLRHPWDATRAAIATALDEQRERAKRISTRLLPPTASTRAPAGEEPVGPHA